jgi:hypothetical protein
MMDYYLRHIKTKPKHIYIFTTKDDLNKNGLNADTSKRYLEFITWKQYVHWNYSRLRMTRGYIYQKTLALWLRLFVRPEGRAEWFSKYTFIKFNIDTKTITMDMMKNYYFDDRGFSLVESVCRKYEIKDVSVVLLPVSSPYAQWHDRLYLHTPYNTIRKKIAVLCEQQDIRFIDISEPLPAQYFADYFHVNSTGSDYIVSLLASSLR